MKRLVLLFGVLTLFTVGIERTLGGPGPSETKDSKAVVQPAPPPECRWTGFYIGVHGGYSWGGQNFRELEESDPAYVFDQDGLFGGGQLGFNLQLGSWFVTGVEGTFSGGDFDDSADIFPGGEHSRAHIGQDWFATIAGRFGVSFWSNRLLAYAKGGAAFTQLDYHTEEINGGEQFNADDDQTAALLGFGLEYAFTCHWTLKVEYNHLFFGRNHVTGIETTGGGSGLERSFRAVDERDTVQLGLNFKF
jgi:outer membrane immunogenic protein